MFVIIRKKSHGSFVSPSELEFLITINANHIELTRNKFISGLKFSRATLSQKQTQSSMEEMLRLFPPVVLKECHFLKRGRHLGGVLQAGHE